MKILKNVLITIMILAMVIMITNVNAYTGGVVDAGDEIEISAVLDNGSAIVNTASSLSNGTMYYQFVEIDSSKYAQIRKLKDELNVAVYYRTYENNQSEQNYDNYVSALNYYQSKYGENLTNFRDSHIEELKSQIIGNLPDYAEDWTLTSGNTISINLASFSGTKYYTAWVKVQKDSRVVYDAQIYELEGTNNTNSGSNNNQNTVIDAGDEIEMPVLFADGTGIVEVANSITNYQMYYQINEIETSKYNEIRKLKDELNVAVYFRTYENNSNEQNYDNYISARTYYLNKYGVELTNFSDDHIEELEAQIKGLLPRFTENWTSVTNNKVDANLSSFSGTKHFVMWVKVVSGERTIYDGDIYELTGTKQETPTTPGNNEENNPQTPTTPGNNEENNSQTPTTPGNNEENNSQTPTTPGNNEENNPQTPTTPGNNEENNSQTPTTPGNNEENKPQTPTTSDKDQQGTISSNNKPATSVENSTTANKVLPYTGKSDIIIIGTVIISIGFALIAYSKFKEI